MKTIGFPKYKSVKVDKKKVKAMTLSKAKKQAWDAFSRFIRLRDCWNDTESLEAHCITCNRVYTFGKGLQAGHFQSGRHTSILLDEEQVYAQCQICNRWRKGMWPEYYEFMVKKYGLEKVQYMIAHRNDVKQYKVADYLRLEQEYKDKARVFEERLGL